MKKEIIQWESGNVTVKLMPSDGFKYITNGESYTESVFLAKDVDETLWHDTNDDPPEPEEPVDPETQELADVVNDAYAMANDLI